MTCPATRERLAGNSFHGGVLSRLLQDLPWERAQRLFKGDKYETQVLLVWQDGGATQLSTTWMAQRAQGQLAWRSWASTPKGEMCSAQMILLQNCPSRTKLRECWGHTKLCR